MSVQTPQPWCDEVYHVMLSTVYLNIYALILVSLNVTKAELCPVSNMKLTQDSDYWPSVKPPG